jgi:hypothetical protein
LGDEGIGFLAVIKLVVFDLVESKGTGREGEMADFG